MTDQNSAAGPSGTTPPGRHRANALVIRETDVMRDGLRGQLVQVAPDELEIDLATAIPPREQIKIRVLNEIQRLDKEVRGTVQSCVSAGEGFRIKVEVLTRLTPLDVSLLRQGMFSQSGPEGRQWL